MIGWPTSNEEERLRKKAVVIFSKTLSWNFSWRYWGKSRKPQLGRLVVSWSKFERDTASRMNQETLQRKRFVIIGSIEQGQIVLFCSQQNIWILSLTDLNLKITVVQNVTSCSLVDTYRDARSHVPQGRAKIKVTLEEATKSQRESTLFFL
jgi:hypothetical protein